MTMDPKTAKDILEQSGVGFDTVGEIDRILLQTKLTPLQAQAVLTRAWYWIISQGRIADRMK